MRNFIITILALMVITFIADEVFANTLQGLYTDYSGKQVQNAKETNRTINSNNTFMPNYSNSQINPTNNDYIIKQGSKNYGQYANTNRRTNPVRIDNPYNHLNDKYVLPAEHADSSSMNFDGDAVKFKKGADGQIYGYDRYGRKVGTYKINNNGTTTQYDNRGNKIGTFK